MTPKEISEWVSQDVQGRLGLLAESLYGHPVKPGNTPIDSIIAAVEQNWLDWDPKDERFVKTVTKIVGNMPSPEEWMKLFAQSQQSPELKSDLMRRLGIKPVAAPVPQSQAPVPAAPSAPAAPATSGAPAPVPGAPPSPMPLSQLPTPKPGKYPGSACPEGVGRFNIHFKRGTVVKAMAIVKSADPGSITYYAAIKPLQQPRKTWRRGGFKTNARGRPKVFANYSGKWCFWHYQTITFRVSNVRMVEVLP